ESSMIEEEKTPIGIVLRCTPTKKGTRPGTEGERREKRARWGEGGRERDGGRRIPFDWASSREDHKSRNLSSFSDDTKKRNFKKRIMRFSFPQRWQRIKITKRSGGFLENMRRQSQEIQDKFK